MRSCRRGPWNMPRRSLLRLGRASRACALTSCTRTGTCPCVGSPPSMTSNGSWWRTGRGSGSATRPLSPRPGRLAHAFEVLQGAQLEDEISDVVGELVEWLRSFRGEGLLELDYGGVARSFPDEDLVDDHSAAEVQTCLEALEAGDLVHAGRVFATLTDRWSGARVAELAN